MMDAQKIISNMNSFLHEDAVCLVGWLNNILPKVTKDWWDDCVLPSLSYTQRDLALSKNYSKETVRKPPKIWKKDEECDIIVM